MEALRVSVTVTSAQEAPFSDTLAVWVLRDVPLSLVAPERFASKFVTEPPTVMDDAPLDSSLRLSPERLLAVTLTAPFNCTSVREALETIILIPLLGLRFSVQSICREPSLILVVMRGRRF